MPLLKLCKSFLYLLQGHICSVIPLSPWLPPPLLLSLLVILLLPYWPVCCSLKNMSAHPLLSFWLQCSSSTVWLLCFHIIAQWSILWSSHLNIIILFPLSCFFYYHLPTFNTRSGVGKLQPLRQIWPTTCFIAFLEYIYAHLFVYCLSDSWVFVLETMWPAKPEMFTT